MPGHGSPHSAEMGPEVAHADAELPWKRSVVWCWEGGLRGLGALLPSGQGTGMTTLGSQGRGRGKPRTKVQAGVLKQSPRG